MRERNLIYLSPRGLSAIKQECPRCHVQKHHAEDYPMWVETFFDEDGHEHKAKVCHNCGYIKQLKR